MVAALLVALGSVNGITEIKLTHMAGGAEPSQTVVTKAPEKGIWFDGGYTVAIESNGILTFNGIKDGKPGWYIAKFDAKLLDQVGEPAADDWLRFLDGSSAGRPDLYPDYGNPQNHYAPMVSFDMGFLDVFDYGDKLQINRGGSVKTYDVHLWTVEPQIRRILNAATDWK